MSNLTLEEAKAYFEQPAFKNGYTYTSGLHLSVLQIQAHLLKSELYFINALIDVIEFDIACKRAGKATSELEATTSKILPLNL
jgi:hypothetical protein